MTWPEQVLHILGSTDEGTGNTFATRMANLPHDERERVEAWLREAKTGREVAGVNHRVRRPDGDIRHVYQQVEARSRWHAAELGTIPIT